MKTLYWEHQYLVGISDGQRNVNCKNLIQIPDDFKIKECLTKWGTLTLISTDGRELEFGSSIQCNDKFKSHVLTIIYDEEFNEIHRTKE